MDFALRAAAFHFLVIAANGRSQFSPETGLGRKGELEFCGTGRSARPFLLSKSLDRQRPLRPKCRRTGDLPRPSTPRPNRPLALCYAAESDRPRERPLLDNPNSHSRPVSATGVSPDRTFPPLLVLSIKVAARRDSAPRDRRTDRSRVRRAPFKFGASTATVRPGMVSACATISEASIICGISFGGTGEHTSISRNPPPRR